MPPLQRPQGNRLPYPNRGGEPIRRDGPVPMEIDAVRRVPLTQMERERLARIGGCFYCRQVGHMINACPNRGENRGRRIAQVERANDDEDQLLGNDEPQ